MFQLVCMFMYFKPGDAEGVAEKIFSKVMAVGDVFRHFKPQLGQLDFFGTVDFDQPISLHPAHSRVNGRSAGIKTVGQSHRLCLFSIPLEFIKQQQVFLDDLRRALFDNHDFKNAC